jgi:hypothetical protein
MKEKLLEIIIRHFCDDSEKNPAFASTEAICSLVKKDYVEKEFVEWVVEAPLIVRTDNNTWEVYETDDAYGWGDPCKEMKIDELHQYWFNSVKK